MVRSPAARRGKNFLGLRAPDVSENTRHCSSLGMAANDKRLDFNGQRAKHSPSILRLAFVLGLSRISMRRFGGWFAGWVLTGLGVEIGQD